MRTPSAPGGKIGPQTHETIEDMHIQEYLQWTQLPRGPRRLGGDAGGQNMRKKTTKDSCGKGTRSDILYMVLGGEMTEHSSIWCQGGEKKHDALPAGESL